MLDVVTHPQVELSHCRNTIQTLSEEISEFKVSTPIGRASAFFIGRKAPFHFKLPKVIIHCTAWHVRGQFWVTWRMYHSWGSKEQFKLQFPTFWKLVNPSHQLQYLERCEDFLVFSLLPDNELMATLHNVLHESTRNEGRKGRNFMIVPCCLPVWRLRMSLQGGCTVQFRQKVRASETLPTCGHPYVNDGNQILRKRKSPS